jgi:hypothetical protein
MVYEYKSKRRHRKEAYRHQLDLSLLKHGYNKPCPQTPWRWSPVQLLGVSAFNSQLSPSGLSKERRRTKHNLYHHFPDQVKFCCLHLLSRGDARQVRNVNLAGLDEDVMKGTRQTH